MTKEEKRKHAAKAAYIILTTAVEELKSLGYKVNGKFPKFDSDTYVIWEFHFYLPPTK